MKWFWRSLLIFLAIVLALLDTSFFSFFNFLGSNILISFIFVLTFSLLLRYQEFVIFIFATAIFFSAFSSIPVWQIISCFYVLPELIFFIKNKYLPEISLLSSAVLFLIASIIFGGILIFGAGDFSNAGFSELGFFVLSNTVLGIFVFMMARKVWERCHGGEIKF